MEKHVLIVEDDTAILEMIEYLLSASGLKVRGVTTVQHFWQTMQAYIPDVIILDIMLPDGNGADLCTQLKLSDDTKHIPIVLMSANLNRRELESRNCAQDYISKPFDVNNFVALVHRQVA